VCPGGYDIIDSTATQDDISGWNIKSGSILVKCTTSSVGARADAERDRGKRERPALRDAPVGAGGFQFGDTRDDAELFCRDAENTWFEKGSRAVCGGTATEGAVQSKKTVLEFCDDFLCRVTLRFEPKGKKTNKAWVQQLTKIRNRLSHKYGKWTSAKVPPRWCRHEVMKCLAGGTIKYRYEWSWGTGERIVLKLQNKKDSKLGPTVKVVYTTPKRSESEVL